MPRGRLEYLRRLLPYLQNQSEDCLYLNIYVPIQGKCLRKHDFFSYSMNYIHKYIYDAEHRPKHWCHSNNIYFWAGVLGIVIHIYFYFYFRLVFGRNEMKCRIESRIMARLSTLSFPKENIPFSDYSWIVFFLFSFHSFLSSSLVRCFLFFLGSIVVVGGGVIIECAAVTFYATWNAREHCLALFVQHLFHFVFPIHSLFGLFCPFIAIFLFLSSHFLIRSSVRFALFFFGCLFPIDGHSKWMRTNDAHLAHFTTRSVAGRARSRRANRLDQSYDSTGSKMFPLYPKQ